MQIDVKAKDEEGNLVFEGKLNGREVGFLLQYAINDLVAQGVLFLLQEPEQNEADEDALRFKFPERKDLN